MQAAEMAHGFDSGPQVQVVSISQKNLDAKFLENILRNGFNGCSRAHGHEYGGLNLAVRRKQSGGTGRASV
jgi:hypothetical protein